MTKELTYEITMCDHAGALIVAKQKDKYIGEVLIWTMNKDEVGFSEIKDISRRSYDFGDFVDKMQELCTRHRPSTIQIRKVYETVPNIS